jgi:hypothetical protein
MIRTAFMSIFWGLVMTLADVRINHLDLVPDSIGYLIVLSGLWRLAPLHGSFGIASGCALTMVVLSLPDLIAAEHPLLTILTIVVDLSMFWAMCGGIAALASASGRGGLAEAALTRRNLLALVSAINLVVIVLARDEPVQVKEFLIPLVVFTFAVLFLLLHLTWRASVELSPAEQGVSAGGWGR